MAQRDKNDLKQREYRDNQGNVHHHTKKYMEGQHGKDRSDESEAQSQED